jgi:uncharacterized protein (TIGR02246 family)
MRYIATIFLLSLCAAPMAEAAPVPEAASGATTELLNDFMRAWSNADAASLASLFAADADLITPDGIVSRGPAEIQVFYAAVFARGYRGSQGRGLIEHVRMLTPDLALVDGTWSIDGAHNPDGSPRARQQGTLVSAMSRSGSAWRILFIRESTSAARFTPVTAISQR